MVLAVIGLAALVFAVVTSNALVAWVCIGASALGVLLLIVDAVRDRRRRAGPVDAPKKAEPSAEPEDASEAPDAAGEAPEETGEAPEEIVEAGNTVAVDADELADDDPADHDTD